LLLVLNLVYLWLMFERTKKDDDGSLPYGTLGCLGMVVTWALQYYSYVGILEQAGNSKKTSKDALVGGMHLDLLALTVVVQYMSLLHSTRWLLLCTVGVPLYAAYSMYITVYGSTGTSASSSNTPQVDQDDPTFKARQEKRQKRAEWRKQRWG
jgi:hypothetical protein